MEKHNGSSGFDSCLSTKKESILYPFILIGGYKHHIGTAGIKFDTDAECIAAGYRWMALDRETQMAMRTKPDYNKFVPARRD